jgi:hypothetical protein
VASAQLLRDGDSFGNGPEESAGHPYKTLAKKFGWKPDRLERKFLLLVAALQV